MTDDKSTYELINSQPIGIPVFHEIALRLQQMMSDNSYRIEEVIKLINEDSALAATMLKHANSTYNTGKFHITTIKDAVVRLGSQHIVNLAFTASIDNTKSKNTIINSYMKQLWLHSHRVAIISSWFAVEVKQEKLVKDINADEVYLAGLLHDIGKLYILKALDNLAEEGSIKLNKIDIRKTIDRYGIILGVKSLTYWNIPPLYINAVKRHEGENWKIGINDDMIAIIRIACRLISFTDENNELTPNSKVFKNITNELVFLNMDNLDYLCCIVKAVTD
ncbi:MAG: HDOD domain-containing protein [Legionella sp.]|uniref:HDOD domain-containing protein n=1 Tax=Legionella sp. TaxID=459 RepID=UPI002849DECE|nr:HDOD domain-containing protein [Legionella sp.]